MKMMSFNPDIYLTLDAVGNRYGVRPSEILRYHPMDGRGLLLDIRCMKTGLEAESQSPTVSGQYQAKKHSWDNEAYQDVMRNII